MLAKFGDNGKAAVSKLSTNSSSHGNVYGADLNFRATGGVGVPNFL